MTAAQAKLVGAAALALLAWWFGTRAAAARVTSTLEINDDVYSPHFGEPITETEDENHRRLVELVADSNTAIAAFDAAHPEGIP